MSNNEGLVSYSDFYAFFKRKILYMKFDNLNKCSNYKKEKEL